MPLRNERGNAVTVRWRESLLHRGLLIAKWFTCRARLRPSIILVLAFISLSFVIAWSYILSIYIDANTRPLTVRGGNLVNEHNLDGYKYIVVWAGCFGKADCGWGSGPKLFRGCPQSKCFLTTDRNLLRQASMVIFHIRDMNNILHPDLPPHHDPDQLWVFFTHESPFYTWTGYIPYVIGRLEYLNGLFNATMTYMRQSDFYLPYGMYQRRNTPIRTGDIIPAENKTKLILWVVSNCQRTLFRNFYIKELQKHIDIDIYGKCSGVPVPCDSKSPPDCFKRFLQQYKFYLAFENAQCKDYITEKFWRTLSMSVVPIALGGYPEDYVALAPPDSYLHVDNFTGPDHLARYIRYLDQNDRAYNGYLNWIKKYSIGGDSGAFCKMCEVAHNETILPKRDSNISSWYSPNRLCRDTTPVGSIGLLDIL